MLLKQLFEMESFWFSVREYGAEEDFGPKRDEVTVGWRRLHNEELNDLY
jgi:hypothetical protein